MNATEDRLLKAFKVQAPLVVGSNMSRITAEEQTSAVNDTVQNSINVEFGINTTSKRDVKYLKTKIPIPKIIIKMTKINIPLH